MKRFLTVFQWTSFAIAASLWTLIGWLKFDNYQRQKYFKEGYDHALKHAGNYYRAFGKLPSQEWADKYYNYINTEDGWIPEP